MMVQWSSPLGKDDEGARQARSTPGGGDCAFGPRRFLLAPTLRFPSMSLRTPSPSSSLLLVVALALSGVIVISVSRAIKTTPMRRRRTAVADVKIFDHKNSDSEARRFESHPFWSCSDVVLTAISFMDVTDAIALASVSGVPIHFLFGVLIVPRTHKTCSAAHALLESRTFWLFSLHKLKQRRRIPGHPGRVLSGLPLDELRRMVRRMHTLERVWARPVAHPTDHGLALLPGGFEVEQHVPGSNLLILKNINTEQFLCCDATRLYAPFPERVPFEGEILDMYYVEPTAAGWVQAVLLRNE
jgi:hypothetical protein